MPGGAPGSFAPSGTLSVRTRAPGSPFAAASAAALSVRAGLDRHRVRRAGRRCAATPRPRGWRRARRRARPSPRPRRRSRWWSGRCDGGGGRRRARRGGRRPAASAPARASRPISVGASMTVAATSSTAPSRIRATGPALAICGRLPAGLLDLRQRLFVGLEAVAEHARCRAARRRAPATSSAAPIVGVRRRAATVTRKRPASASTGFIRAAPIAGAAAAATPESMPDEDR